jgi:hypothetical protein
MLARIKVLLGKQKDLFHLQVQRFACQTDAQRALSQLTKRQNIITLANNSIRSIRYMTVRAVLKKAHRLSVLSGKLSPTLKRMKRQLSRRLNRNHALF